MALCIEHSILWSLLKCVVVRFELFASYIVLQVLLVFVLYPPAGGTSTFACLCRLSESEGGEEGERDRPAGE